MDRTTFLAAGRERRIKHLPDVPGLDGGAHIRSLTEFEKSEYEQSQLTRSKSGKATPEPDRVKRSRAALICLCVCDEHGARLLADEDVEQVLGMDGRITQRLYDAILEHVGYRDSDIGELAKN